MRETRAELGRARRWPTDSGPVGADRASRPLLGFASRQWIAEGSPSSASRPIASVRSLPGLVEQPDAHAGPELGVNGAVGKPPSLQDYISTVPRRARMAPADLADDEAPEPPEPANDAVGTAA